MSHRGYWKTPQEKNSRNAFERSFSMGFGTETDLRDYLGNIVISHDIANEESIKGDSFFEIYSQYDPSLPLALNVKADGLQANLKTLLERYNINNYFFFDMSIPDSLSYMEHGLTFFSRQSEYELRPAFYDQCKGVWLDAFESRWYDANLISAHLEQGKQVAIVSPELHRRAAQPLWAYLREQQLHTEAQILLCTDLPEEAQQYFLNPE